MNDYFKGIMDVVNKSIEELDIETFNRLEDDVVAILNAGGKLLSFNQLALGPLSQGLWP